MGKQINRPIAEKRNFLPKPQVGSATDCDGHEETEDGCQEKPWLPRAEQRFIDTVCELSIPEAEFAQERDKDGLKKLKKARKK